MTEREIAGNSLEAAFLLARTHHTRKYRQFLDWHKRAYPSLWAGDPTIPDPPEPKPWDPAILTAENNRLAAMAMAGTHFHFPDLIDSYLDECRRENPPTWWDRKPIEIRVPVANRPLVFCLPTALKCEVWRGVDNLGGEVRVYARPSSAVTLQAASEFPREGQWSLTPTEEAGPQNHDHEAGGPPEDLRLNGVLAQFDDGLIHKAGGVCEASYITRHGSLLLRAWVWTFPWSDEQRTFLLIRNERPTGLTADGNQPTCLDYGAPEESRALLTLEDEDARIRWAEHLGIPDAPIRTLVPDLPLRAGEQFGFEWWHGGEPVDLPVLPISGYGDILGDVAPIEEGPDDWDLNHAVAINGLADRQYSQLDDPLGHIDLVRDFGDFNRDFEGPSESRRKTHNNEYDWQVGLLRLAARLESPTAYQMAERGAFHAANVDLYHIDDGPLEWLWGAPFPHTDHGSAGTSRPHRGNSPAVGHWNLRAARIMQLVGGDNPILRDAADFLADVTMRKAEGGPDMPWLWKVGGELRSIAYGMHLLLDEWLFMGRDEARPLIVSSIQTMLDAKKAWLGQPGPPPYGDDRYKPWMACLAAEAMMRAAEAGIVEAHIALGHLREAILEHGINRDRSPICLFYEVGWGANAHRTRDDDMPGAFWNLLAADVLVDVAPRDARELAESACASGGAYPGNDPRTWHSLQAALGMATYGHHYAIRAAALPPSPPMD